MSTIYAIINQKGGVGKSTTAQSLAAGLAKRGSRVLSVDLDAQGNLSYAAAAALNAPTSLDILTGDASAPDAIQHTPSGDIIPSSHALAGADAYLTETGKEYRLREALSGLDYDYIVIDTPPALGVLTVNALTACNGVIIPAQADIFSLQGIEQLAGTIGPVKKYCNPSLRVEGILLTRYNPRSVLSRDVAELAGQLAERLGTRLFRAAIREAIAVKEAQISQQSLYSYAPGAKVTHDYDLFISELLGEEIHNG